MSEAFNSSFLLSVITFAYFGAAFFYLLFLVFRSDRLGVVGTWVTLITVVVQTAAILWRWIESYQLGIGHAPFSNLYESLVLFAWTIAVVYLIMERYTRNRTIGAFVMPLAFLSMAYAGLKPDEIEPLVPALKSNWLIAHVITCFIGYAAFALAAGLAVVYLIKHAAPGRTDGFIARLPALSAVENLIYRNIILGFLMLTAGIITGSIWAHSAWGSYWSWDPKETWSLITWLVYAAILHARMVKGWDGKRIAIMAIIGFACVLFTYFGVNLFLKGLHSYAR